MTDWNAADAEGNYRTLLEESRTEPQRIVKRGTPAAVVVSYQAWLAAEPLVLATRNTRDFEGYGLVLYNPFGGIHG